jgi:hypothetical protein
MLLGAVLTVALLSSASEARACSPPEVPSIVLAHASVSSEGIIAGVLNECDDCDLDGMYVERISDHARVPGRRIELRAELSGQGWIGFQPDQPLTPGERYVVHVPPHDRSPYATEPAVFTAVAAHAAELTASGYYHAERIGVETVACASYDYGAIGGLCSAPVFYAYSEQRATLQVTPSGEGASQHAYRVSWMADGVRVGGASTQTGDAFFHAFQQTPASVCFELFALPLVTGNEQRIAGECFSTAKDELGRISGTFGAQGETLRSCLAPPKGFEQAWCDALRSSASDRGEAVERAREECDWDDVPDESDPGDTTDPTGDPPPEANQSSSGCHVSAAPAGLFSGAIWSLAALLVFVHRARRPRV